MAAHPSSNDWSPLSVTSPALDQIRGQADRRYQAALVGHALLHDVEAGAVVDGRAHEGQTERDVDGVPERGQLDRDQPLVVVLREHGVELAPGRPREQAVRRIRAADVEALRAQADEGGR